MNKIVFIFGTRPEIIKLYPLVVDCDRRKLDYFLIHTNQHYDQKMDGVFFKKLGIPKPKYNLNVGSCTHGEQIGKMLERIEKVLVSNRPNVVIVQGDTNSVLAGALISSRYNIKVAHVEAGLRSYERSMPEEINRILTDHVADYLFCPTRKQQNILISENIPRNRIFITGNTIVDSVYRTLEIAEKKSTILHDLHLKNQKYFLLTCHRPENTDNLYNFEEIVSGVSHLAMEQNVKCVFPIHPRLKKHVKMIAKFDNIKIIDPVDYFDSLMLQKYSEMIFTDSGGIQEEACILKKKCIILRTNTERPETLTVGGALILSEISSEEIIRCNNKLTKRIIKWSNPFGDGNASRKILDIILKI